MDLSDHAAQLYTCAPEDFVPMRGDLVAQARSDGDRPLASALQALRKPTVAAWLVNLLVRAHPDQINALLDLGAALRAAQDALAGDELRALTTQRRQVVRALAGQIHTLAEEIGRTVSASVEREVEQTLTAALTDEHAGTALQSGTLTRALEPNGVDPVDLDGAVAVVSGTPAHTARPRAPRRSVADREAARRQAEVRAEALARAKETLEKAREERDAARRAVRDAARTAESDARMVDTARTQADDLRARLDDALERLREAQESSTRSEDERQRLSDVLERADQAYERAAFAVREASTD